mmetsp:Transcript_57424/g.181796  ORF Transcript_57424/g.181796 Transcript_57424/m.181796 type:complete len:125 (-) Transcript_57424:204-578(-)
MRKEVASWYPLFCFYFYFFQLTTCICRHRNLGLQAVKTQSSVELYEKIMMEPLTYNPVDLSAILEVVYLVMLHPLDTAEAERGFSLMNRLKHSQRSTISDGILNDFMFVRLHPLENFNPHNAIN